MSDQAALTARDQQLSPTKHRPRCLDCGRFRGRAHDCPAVPDITKTREFERDGVRFIVHGISEERLREAIRAHKEPAMAAAKHKPILRQRTVWSAAMLVATAIAGIYGKDSLPASVGGVPVEDLFGALVVLGGALTVVFRQKVEVVDTQALPSKRPVM